MFEVSKKVRASARGVFTLAASILIDLTEQMVKRIDDRRAGVPSVLLWGQVLDGTGLRATHETTFAAAKGARTSDRHCEVIVSVRRPMRVMAIFPRGHGWFVVRINHATLLPFPERVPWDPECMKMLVAAQPAAVDLMVGDQLVIELEREYNPNW